MGATEAGSIKNTMNRRVKSLHGGPGFERRRFIQAGATVLARTDTGIGIGIGIGACTTAPLWFRLQACYLQDTFLASLPLPR